MDFDPTLRRWNQWGGRKKKRKKKKKRSIAEHRRASDARESAKWQNVKKNDTRWTIYLRFYGRFTEALAEPLLRASAASHHIQHERVASTGPLVIALGVAYVPKTLSGTPDTVWCPPSCLPLSKTCQSGDDPYVRSQSRGWPERRRSVTAWLPSRLAGAILSLSTAPASPSLLFVILYIVSLCSRPNIQVSPSFFSLKLRVFD